MNVYTQADYRRMGIAKKMIEIIIDDAKERGVTEIILDATDMGKPLYKAIGFLPFHSGMIIKLN